ncbi:hypothetical protein CWATWH0005_2536 [Crocosphaera watsonii WH 0005]|uniref:Uncharacterized protein n=1 Tax=Crocosphaera watsonii WH 0005 TaxID=423472 RepID=T2J1F5_CROWT|nr:hypothetical protein CWATWH0005_2536 [Crocosphaera watsonii WH 0005]
MKSISGKKLCKIVEKKGWTLKKIPEVITFMKKLMKTKYFLFLFIVIKT